MRYLPNIQTPDDLKHLTYADLKTLSTEIREYLNQVIPSIGGHFASSLGSVEITLALHYVFNAPKDKIVWDVGHQAYVHKILTGRRDALKTIRQFGGISGFLKRSESEYDVIGAGHASTAISSALGIAQARDLNQENFNVIAVVGDGGMTGGLSYEGLNNVGMLQTDMIVLLNDNRMSISPNVGAMSQYLTNIITNPLYNRFKAEIWKMTGKLPARDKVRLFARKMEESIKNMLVPGMLFEDLGFKYIGPVDGHNIEDLINILKKVKNYKGPYLIHAITSKGKGIEQAEKDPTKYHGVKPVSKIRTDNGPKIPTYTEVLGATMVELAEENPKLCAITAAMTEGTGLVDFREQFSDRFFDVGIAEGHAVSFAAGLVTENMRPVCVIYSTFLQRAFDHIIHDICIQHLPVIFALDRAGLAGEDGPTHHGCYDLSYLNCMPEMIITAPRDGSELRDLLYTALMQNSNPFAIRYPKDSAITPLDKNGMKTIPIGVWEELAAGEDIAVLAVGSMVDIAKQAHIELQEKGVTTELINCRFIKPVDMEMLTWLANRFKIIVTLEENALHGGFGSTIARTFQDNAWYKTRLMHIGLPDKFIAHGERNQLLDMVELSAHCITDRILAMYKQRSKNVFSFLS